MADKYQLGPDEEWLKQTNDDLSQQVRRLQGRIVGLWAMVVLLSLLLAWTIYRFVEVRPIQELWRL